MRPSTVVLLGVCAPLLIFVAVGCGDDATADPEPGAGGQADDAGDGSKDATIHADGAEAGSADASVDKEQDAAIDGLADAPSDGPGSDAPPGPPDFSFVAFADNQFATTSCTSGIPERMDIPKEILKRKPAFLIEAGDLMDHGYEDGAYDEYVSCYHAMLAKIPLFPGPGNHDMAFGNGKYGIWNFKTYLENQLHKRNATVVGSSYAKDYKLWYEDDTHTYSTDPNHAVSPGVPSGFSFKTFYAFRFKNTYFLSFEQGGHYWTDTPTAWVEKHLKAARADPAVDHVFVYLHNPMYSTVIPEACSGPECIKPVRDAYEALFRKYNVTVVFAGHTHVYEHFDVPDDGHATFQDPPPKQYPHDGSSIQYVVTGGAGPPVCGSHEKEKSYNYLQKRKCGLHFTLVKVTGARLDLEVISVNHDDKGTGYTATTWDAFSVQ